MARITVAPFRREQNRIARKKKPNGLASLEWKKRVINCTIPPVDKNSLIEIECPWNEERKLTATKDTANWKAGKWYKDRRDAEKKRIREETFDEEKNRSGKYMYNKKSKRKPWYMLDTRKRWRYEERKKSYGTCVDWYRVPSEAAEMYNRTVPKKMTMQEYWEALVQHKLAKWIRKNPRPIKDDANNPDLFEAQYIPEWEAKRDLALERFRDFVVSMYDKLPLSGRFKKSDNNYVEEHVADIKDINGEGHKVNELNPETSKLLKSVQKVTDDTKAKRSNLVATNLKDHKRTHGRIILPSMKNAA